MSKTRNTPLIFIGILGFIGVVAAAAATHWLSPDLPETLKLAWDHAVQFNLIHTAAMIGIFAVLKTLDPDSTAAWWLGHSFVLLFIGTTIFCGTVYAMCLGVPGKEVGPMAPVGGVTMMLGWLTVVLAGFWE